MQTQHTYISLEKAYEVRHWMAELNVSERQLYCAVREVGKRLPDLRLHLGKAAIARFDKEPHASTLTR